MKYVGEKTLVERNSNDEYLITVLYDERKLADYLSKRSANRAFQKAKKEGEATSTRMGGSIVLVIDYLKNPN